MMMIMIIIIIIIIIMCKRETDLTLFEMSCR
jgi:hypothetical protein